MHGNTLQIIFPKNRCQALFDSNNDTGKKTLNNEGQYILALQYPNVAFHNYKLYQTNRANNILIHPEMPSVQFSVKYKK